jgi:hypothetical protein
MLTIKDCLNSYSVTEAALFIVSKVAYDRKKGYTRSHDGKTFWEFGHKLDVVVSRLNRKIKNNKFEFSPVLKIERNLKGNKTREIYISQWEDKIVERWLNVSLNRLLNKWFSSQSFAYRIDFGLDKCQFEAVKKLKKSRYVAKRDISNYFYSIDNEILLDKLKKLIDENDYLYKLVSQRIKFEYVNENEEEINTSDIGIPFGSSFACLLANIYLTNLDKSMNKFNVGYIRYADDFLIMSNDENEFNKAVEFFDESIRELKLEIKDTKKEELDIEKESVNFLGLVFTKDHVRLSVIKQRKIIRFFNTALEVNKNKIKKQKTIEGKLELAVQICSEVLKSRIRSIAIVDYYLKHLTDDNQLRIMDRLIVETLLKYVCGEKKFRKRMFQIATPGKLRTMGLQSLVHRSRLIKHGHIKTNFMSLYDELMENKYYQAIERQKSRIDKIKLHHKIKKIQPVEQTFVP